MSLSGTVAVVTGASRGVGKGIAQELLEQGARVFVTGRSRDDLAYAGDRGPCGDGMRCSRRRPGPLLRRPARRSATDPDVLALTGQRLVAAALGAKYGFTDIDGNTPKPLTLSDV